MRRYRQCELRRGTTREVVWIPENFGKIGKIVRVGDDDGWTVSDVGAVRTEDYLLAHERDFAGHRSRTDI